MNEIKRFIPKNKIIKSILIVGLFIIFSFHLMKGIKSGFTFNQFSMVIFVFLAYAVQKEDRKIYSIVFVLQGGMSNLTMGSPGLEAVLFFFAALLFFDNLKTVIFISILIPISIIAYDYIGIGGTTSQITECIIFQILWTAFFYLAIIHKTTKINHLSLTTPLTKRQLIILKYLSLGYTRKELPDKVPQRELWKYEIEKFTFNIINSEMTNIYEALNIKTEPQLWLWYAEKTEKARFTANN